MCLKRSLLRKFYPSSYVDKSILLIICSPLFADYGNVNINEATISIRC